MKYKKFRERYMFEKSVNDEKEDFDIVKKWLSHPDVQNKLYGNRSILISNGIKVHVR